MRFLNKSTITVKRRGAVRWVRGRAIQDQTRDVTVKGMIQPERNLTAIRETFGSHIEAAIKVYTKERLMTKEKGKSADCICYDGREWEVAEVRKYDDLIPHFKIIAILKKDET